MRFKVLAALLVSSATALANPQDELAAAQQSVHEATTRVSYYEMQATIAERDIATARIQLDTTSKQRDKARYTQAVSDEREAQARAARSRDETDRARKDLQASNEQVRRLEGSARASR